jgi:hypothetical protein
MAEETSMSVITIRESDSGAAAKPKPPAPGPETKALLKRAENGDESCLPEIRSLLADGERGDRLTEWFGSSAEWFRRFIIEEAAGKGLMSQEAVKRKLDVVRSELEGPNPTGLERLLAERASLCWFMVHWYETTVTNMRGLTIAQADFHQRKIDRAHARFLSAVRTLAQVRKLGLPTLQVNIGANQVNVA